MRLNTILDAALLAKAVAGSFAFTWDEQESHALDQQTTSALADVFAADFIAAHRLTAAPTAPVLAPVRSTEALAGQIRAAGPSATLLLDQPRDLPRFVPVLAARLDLNPYPDAFAALGFAAGVRRAIALAQNLPLTGNAVAIHLRGGDILHGTHAHHATYLHKAPSVLEIDGLITKLTGMGHKVWLIGQERDVQACMARRHAGVTLPPDVAQGDVAQVLFDAVLMSRMQAVWGGNSGVTLLSRRLGGQPFHDLARLPPISDPGAWRHDPLAAPAFAEISPAMKAHTYVKVITATDPADWTDLHRDLIALARHWRPDSKFLGLVQICVLTRLGHAAQAESAAKALLATPLPPVILPEMGYAFLTEAEHYFPQRLTAPLAEAPLHGHPALQVFAALRQRLSDPDAAETALAPALAALGPASVDPGFRAMTDRFWRDTAPGGQAGLRPACRGSS